MWEAMSCATKGRSFALHLGGHFFSLNITEYRGISQGGRGLYCVGLGSGECLGEGFFVAAELLGHHRCHG